MNLDPTCSAHTDLYPLDPVGSYTAMTSTLAESMFSLAMYFSESQLGLVMAS